MFDRDSPLSSPSTSPIMSTSSSPPLQISPSLSSPSARLPSSVPESTAVVLSNSNFFSFIIDIADDGSSRIAYEKDCIEDISFLSKFITKQVLAISPTKSPFETTFIQCSYDKTFYASFSFNIADILSTTYFRKVCFVLGHQDRTILVNALTKMKKLFEKIIQKIQISSILTLKADNDELQKEVDMTQFDNFIKSLDPELSSDIKKLLQKTENRDFKEITQFETLFEQELNNIIDSLPKSQFLSYVQMRGTLRSEGSIFKFGQFQTLPEFVTFIQTANMRSFDYKLLDLVDSGALFHCIFSVLSGRTLVIRSSDFEGAKALGMKFAVFAPFFDESHFAAFDKITVAGALRYAIVVVKEFPPETGGAVSFLDLGNKMYKGESCPRKSFVWKTGENISKSNEASFIVSCYREVKKVAGKLTIACMSSSGDKSSTLQNLSDYGLEKDDEPIFRYWMSCATNVQKSRPVISSNRSKFGVVITAL